MNKNLLIIGAGIFAVIAYEIAQEMKCFDKIDFVDDERIVAENGIAVLGTTQEIYNSFGNYTNAVVAIGNPDIRLDMLHKITEKTEMTIVSLVSPRAYVSPSARIECGSVIEPMAVVHAGCVISKGCIISAGAVVNHASTCGEGVHVDCNATVEGYCSVPSKTKVCCGAVYEKEDQR